MTRRIPASTLAKAKNSLMDVVRRRADLALAQVIPPPPQPSTPSPPTSLEETLAWQELAILHLTFDFERDSEDFPFIVDDDFVLIGLEPLEAAFYVARLFRRGFVTSTEEPYNLTPTGKELFSSNTLGEGTRKLIRPLIDERRDLTGV